MHATTFSHYRFLLKKDNFIHIYLIYLSHRVAYYILRYCLSIKKLMFFLRKTPSRSYKRNRQHTNDPRNINEHSFGHGHVYHFITASSVWRSGIEESPGPALPALLSSVNGLFPLMSIMLQSPMLNIMDMTDYEDGLIAWIRTNRTNPPTN